MPKVEVLRRDTLKQCKEEVSIQVRGGPGGTPAREGLWGGHGDTRTLQELQMEDGISGVPSLAVAPYPGGPLTLCVLLCPQRQVRHPFVHGLGDSWQGQRHLFISE